MSVTIVIAHYNENIDWIKKLPSDNVHVYTKGGVDITGDYRISYLPNVGRESHTYLHYIIEHYDSLPDIVFFTQGRDDHIRAEQILQSISALFNPVNSGLSFITNRIEARTINNIYFSEDYRIHYWNGEFLDAAECNFKEWFTKYICPSFDFSRALLINFGACFGIKKEAILSRSKEYYMNLLEQLKTHRNPEVGHFFERSWIYIFNCESRLARI